MSVTNKVSNSQARNWEPAANRQPRLPPGTRRASSRNAGAAISHCAREGDLMEEDVEEKKE
eukprot:5246066-Pyramimonas_sp.AAC.1